MTGSGRYARIAFLAACGLVCAPMCAQAGAESGISLAAFLAGQSGPPAKLPDPDPEPPPSYGLGHRPDTWESWEVPGRLRRFSGRFHVGLVNFVKSSRAFWTNNPLKYMTASEIVMLDSLWTGNTVAVSVEGTVHFTPLVGLSAEFSWCSFTREVSPPAIHFEYVNSTDNRRLISTGDLSLYRLVVCTRIDVPAWEALFKPGDLFIFDGAPEKSGFVPFIELGAGVSLIDTVNVDVSVTSGATVTTVKRTLYERAINPAFLFGIGAEYRIGLFGVFAKFTYAWNGKPKSGWSPYTDSAGDLNTYSFNLGAAAYF